MEPLIEARELNKRYWEFSLHGVSLEIHSGSILGIFGPNGAGKTTLVKLLAGQIPADSGVVRVFGFDYREHEKEIKDRIGYAPQKPPFFPDRSLDYTARFAASLFSRWDGGLFSRLVERFRLPR